jgi:ribosomal protein S27E
MNLHRIEHLLESAKDPSEREEKMTVMEAIEKTPGERKPGFTREAAFNLTVDDLDPEKGTKLDGECPDCGSDTLRAVRGRTRIEIHCDGCESELLEL